MTMREFKSAAEMLKITGTYRLNEMMLDMEEKMVKRAQNGHTYLLLNMLDEKDEFNISFDDMSFVFNELQRAGYHVEDEGETWFIRWSV